MIEIKNLYKTFFSELGTEKQVFTLLNVLNGQITPDSGEIILNGKNISNVEKYKRSQWISQVYQNPTQGTAPSMTVMENLSMAKNKGKKFNFTFGLDLKNMKFYEKQLESLGLGLEKQLFTQVGLLSGGQRQCCL